jgi:hypothetical protein
MPTPATSTETAALRDQRRREASVRYARYVQDLLDRRADLQGVSGLADLISDATRWAA